jgi:predicted dehydrogenase
MRFGLLGTGPWAVEAHAPGLAAEPGVEFVGVWGRSEARAAALAHAYGVRTYPEPEALFADVDAVSIALPPDVQAGLALRAARAGRHLLLDKPLALSVPAADELVAEVSARGLASLVFFTKRFTPEVEQFLAGVAGTGGWSGGRAVHLSGALEAGSPYAASPWRHRHGGLWDVGPHVLSQVLPVLGPVTDVYANDGPDATAHLILRHEAGAVSTAALSIAAPQAAVYQEIVVYGTAGQVPVPQAFPEKVAAYRSALRQLVATALGTPPRCHPCDARLGREIVAVLAAADESRRTGRTAAVAPDPNRSAG